MLVGVGGSAHETPSLRPSAGCVDSRIRAKSKRSGCRGCEHGHAGRTAGGGGGAAGADGPDGVSGGADRGASELAGDVSAGDGGGTSDGAEPVAGVSEREREADAADPKAEQMRELRLPTKFYAYGVTRIQLEQVMFADGSFWTAMGHTSCALNVVGSAERIGR